MDRRKALEDYEAAVAEGEALAAREDKRPSSIMVYACPLCGYWRAERATGVHVAYVDNGPGRRHELIATPYVLPDA